MANKKQARMKRAARARLHIRGLGMRRLCVHRTPKHVYAQIISADGGKVLASASSLDQELRGEGVFGGNVEMAKRVGQKIGERAVKAGIKSIAFDRGGFKYHGRIKALAEAAREQGLDF